MEQSDDGRKFNRGKLLNIGFQLAARAGDHDVYVFHDVDLLPSKELLPYYRRTPAGGPVHIARVWGRYSGNPKYIGGAVAFTSADFRRINGFPNTFWGWGGEDDEMRRRIDEVTSIRCVFWGVEGRALDCLFLPTYTYTHAEWHDRSGSRCRPRPPGRWRTWRSRV